MTEKYHDLLVTVGKNIQFQRKKLNLSQETLANNLHMDRKHISDIENGKQNLTLETFFKLSEGLQIDILELLKKQE